MSGEQRLLARLQPLELLRVLREHDVDFLVIGGVAVAAHGYVRATKDVDIIPEPSATNALRRCQRFHPASTLRRAFRRGDVITEH